MPAKTEHPDFKQPENADIAIWRYMDFIKLISMLENKGLFFCRADLLGDPFEGSYARANEELRPTIYKEMCEQLNITLEKFLDAIKKMGGDFLKWKRQWMMINCWHMGEHESAAMWNLYAKTNESVCIQSRYSLLVDCLPEDTFIGEVQYIDYNKEWMPERNIYSPFMHKRTSFEHEHEVRAIFDKAPKGPLPMLDKTKVPPKGGIWIPVDISKLIESIYLSPLSPEWIYDLINKVIIKYGVKIEIKKSSLTDEPFF
jgi:hypothetical protein